MAMFKKETLLVGGQITAELRAALLGHRDYNVCSNFRRLVQTNAGQCFERLCYVATRKVPVISVHHFGVNMPQLLRDNFQGNTQSNPSARCGVSQLMKSESFNFCQRAGAAHSFLLSIFGPGLATFA